MANPGRGDVDELDFARRRADSQAVAGDQLMLYGPAGRIARIALLVDQLDDLGFRTELAADVLDAFPHAELHVVHDRRSEPHAPVAGRKPTVWGGTGQRRGFLRRNEAPVLRVPQLGDYDVLLRVGDRRSRPFVARSDALDLTYILDLEGGVDACGRPTGRVGPTLQDRGVLSSVDVVWCASRWLMGTLRRRWRVDANLLFPGTDLDGVVRTDGPRRRILAVGGGVDATWQSRLATLARVRRDLELVLHGPRSEHPQRQGWQHAEPTPETFRALLPDTLAVLVPPSDGFEPRAIWAQQAGVPVIAPMRGGAAETIEGLERRAPTGVLLEELRDEALLDAVAFVEQRAALFTVDAIQTNAKRWSRARFRGTL